MVGVLMPSDTAEKRLGSILILLRLGKRIKGLFRLMAEPFLWEQAYAEIASTRVLSRVA